MDQPLRFLYGLHERFVLFPYERGGRKIRLVLRQRALQGLLQHATFGRLPTPIASPLVVGELLGLTSPHAATFVPFACDGEALNKLKKNKPHWTMRQYRAVAFGDKQVRFEAGLSGIFAAHTAIYSYELLQQLVKDEQHESDTRAGVPQR
jgi:hypothetical protein